MFPEFLQHLFLIPCLLKFLPEGVDEHSCLRHHEPFQHIVSHDGLRPAMARFVNIDTVEVCAECLLNLRCLGTKKGFADQSTTSLHKTNSKVHRVGNDEVDLRCIHFGDSSVHWFHVHEHLSHSFGTVLKRFPLPSTSTIETLVSCYVKSPFTTSAPLIFGSSYLSTQTTSGDLYVDLLCFMASAAQPPFPVPMSSTRYPSPNTPNRWCISISDRALLVLYS